MPRPEQEMQAEINALREAILEYLSEVDNPVPDAIYRRVLRDRLRRLVGFQLPDGSVLPIHMDRSR